MRDVNNSEAPAETNETRKVIREKLLHGKSARRWINERKDFLGRLFGGALTSWDVRFSEC